jgi:CRP-like cAMP-binding protein
LNTERSHFDASARSLSGIKLLLEAPPEIISDLESRCKWVEFAPNQVIVDRDDEGTDVFLIVRGKVKIMDFQADGQEVSLAELGAGDSFGELSAIDAKKRSARVLAMDHTLVAVVDRNDFRQLILKCPGIGLALLKRFAGVIRTLDKRITALSTRTPQQRVYFELIRLSEPNPAGDGTWVIENFPPHGEIASWAGTGREDVASAVGKLAREGIVERKHKTLVIRDHARLKMLAEMG